MFMKLKWNLNIFKSDIYYRVRLFYIYFWLFLVALINKENFRYSYGRKMSVERMKQETIKLPVNSEWNPDREYMENYIKNLPYGDRI